MATIRITFTGITEEVEEKIKSYFSMYATAGYGTSIDYDNTNEDGIRTVEISRYSSCD